MSFLFETRQELTFFVKTENIQTFFNVIVRANLTVIIWASFVQQTLAKVGRGNDL